MKNAGTKNDNEAVVTSESDYEAPRIELVLTGEDLEREVHYAGTPSNGFIP